MPFTIFIRKGIQIYAVNSQFSDFVQLLHNTVIFDRSFLTFINVLK